MLCGTVPALQEPTALCRGPSLGRVPGTCLLDVKGVCVTVCYDSTNPHTNLMRRASFPHFIDELITKISKGVNDTGRGGVVERDNDGVMEGARVGSNPGRCPGKTAHHRSRC